MKSFSNSVNLSLEAVWTELEAFSKFVVRGRNQHRRDKCYQMLVKVSKDLKRYRKVSFGDLNRFSKRPSVKSNAVKDVVKKTSRCLRFTENLIQFLEKVFEEVQKQLHIGLFIPMNLLMLSSVSRIWYMFQYHKKVLSDLLHKITQDSLALPRHGSSLVGTSGQSIRGPDSIGTAVARKANTDSLPLTSGTTNTSSLTHPLANAATNITRDSAESSRSEENADTATVIRRNISLGEVNLESRIDTQCSSASPHVFSDTATTVMTDPTSNSPLTGAVTVGRDPGDSLASRARQRKRLVRRKLLKRIPLMLLRRDRVLWRRRSVMKIRKWQARRKLLKQMKLTI